jgi:hypothetical protein
MSSLPARHSDARKTVCVKCDHALMLDRAMNHEIATAVPRIAAGP